VVSGVLRALAICAPVVLLGSLASLAQASGSTALAADIPAQPLAQALAAFTRQTGLQVLYVSNVVRDQRSHVAPAGLSANEALTRLLEGTGLRFERLTARSARILAGAGAPPETAFVPLTLEQVVVTARRRAEQLDRVPIDMAVWTEEAMEASQIKGITQIGALTPGVDFGSRTDVGGDLYTVLTIRGVSGRHGTAVGIFLDDIPIPPARAVTYLRVFPVTFDLNRVEVLRGPQPVLLGDHTQGGAIRFITNEPSLVEYTGLATGEWATTERGGMSYEAGAAVGGPVIKDVVGYRVSGWYRSDGGYVDRVDPNTGAVVDVNSNRYLIESVRSTLTFAPTDLVRITPSLVYQSVNVRDTSSFYSDLSSPGDGELRNGSLLRQPLNDAFYLASLKLTAGFGGANLNALSSYFDRTVTATVANAGLATHHGQKQRVFSQELRLTSAEPSARLTWIAGALFSSDRVRDPVSTFVPPLTLADTTTTQQSELAGFGEISLKTAKRLTATIGLRIGRSRYESVTETPPVFHAAATDTWTTPRFSLSYQADEHNLLYVTAAKGYGSGGVYPAVPICGDSAAAYPPDTLWSYEIGTKSDVLGGRMHVYTSAFHIRWNNGQTIYVPERCEVSPMPGAAVSNGFSLELQGLLTERAILDLGVGYTDAHYAQTILVAGAPLVRAGDAVDGGGEPTSPWRVTASLERQFPLPGGLTGSLRVEDVFRSRNPGPFYYEDPASAYYDHARGPDPSVNVLNVRASVRWLHVDVAAFIRNAADAQPALAPTGRAAWTLTPRTIGVSGTWRF
jgi:outer membrane receptor protein involved in Fe transport